MTDIKIKSVSTDHPAEDTRMLVEGDTIDFINDIKVHDAITGKLTKKIKYTTHITVDKVENKKVTIKFNSIRELQEVEEI